MAGLKAAILGPQIAKSGVSRPSNLLGSTYEHPYRRYVSAHTASYGSSRERPQLPLQRMPPVTIT